ncbi:hypothetical protein V8C42DRAFT_154218 [Trichoderma barbatum]
MCGSGIPRGTCPSARTGGVLGVSYYIGRASSFWMIGCVLLASAFGMALYRMGHVLTSSLFFSLLLISYTTTALRHNGVARLLLLASLHTLTQPIHPSLWLGLFPPCFRFTVVKRSIGTTTRYEICICWFA